MHDAESQKRTGCAKESKHHAYRRKETAWELKNAVCAAGGARSLCMYAGRWNLGSYQEAIFHTPPGRVPEGSLRLDVVYTAPAARRCHPSAQTEFSSVLELDTPDQRPSASNRRERRGQRFAASQMSGLMTPGSPVRSCRQGHRSGVFFWLLEHWV